MRRVRLESVHTVIIMSGSPLFRLSTDAAIRMPIHTLSSVMRGLHRDDWAPPASKGKICVVWCAAAR